MLGRLAAAALALPVVGLAAASPAAAALPRVSIETAGEIGDGAKRTARLRVSGPQGYAGRAGVELRGTSSLRFPKKSYSLETRTRTGRARDVGLLGLPRESDWVLVSQYADQTRMRNPLGYAAARELGRWAAGTRFVELTVNGRFRGTYLLAERVKLGPRRVAAGPGAQLLELADTREPGAFRGPATGRFYGFHHPRAEKVGGAARERAIAQVVDLERTLAARGNWRALLDEAGAVDYVLLQELVKNNDAFSRSTFLTAGDGPIRLGPVWDLDRAFGDPALQGEPGAPEGWSTPTRPIASALLADPAFAQRLAARWREVRAAGLAAALDAALVRNAARLRAAVARDERTWPSTRRPGHAAEVARLRAWLTTRIGWIDAHVDRIGAG